MKIIFRYVWLIFLILGCQREIGIENTELTLKIVEESSNEPIKGSIDVYQYEKSIYGRYWWTVHEVYKKNIDRDGKVDIRIDSLGFYGVRIYKKGEELWFCSDEFDAKEMNFDSTYEIKCSD